MSIDFESEMANFEIERLVKYFEYKYPGISKVKLSTSKSISQIINQNGYQYTVNRIILTIIYFYKRRMKGKL